MLFHVSYALILGLKDEPYDEIIIVHVFFCCRDGLVGHTYSGAILPCWERVLPCSMPPHCLLLFLTVIS